MLERHSILKELADEFKTEEDDPSKKQQRQAQLERQNKEFKDKMAKGASSGDATKLMEKIRSEQED